MGDNRVFTEDEIDDHVVKFFKDLYRAEPAVNNGIIGKMIPELVTDMQNKEIIKILDFREIHEAVMDMDPSSAPGPYGFT